MDLGLNPVVAIALRAILLAIFVEIVTGKALKSWMKSPSPSSADSRAGRSSDRDRDALFFVCFVTCLWFVKIAVRGVDVVAEMGGWMAGIWFLLGMVVLYSSARVVYYLRDRRHPPLPAPKAD